MSDHDTKTCFLKGRYVGENTRIIYNLMDYTDTIKCYNHSDEMKVTGLDFTTIIVTSCMKWGCVAKCRKL